MKYWYVADWMKAVGNDEAKREKARTALTGVSITYDSYRNTRPFTENATIINVDFENRQIEYHDGIFPARRETMSQFDIQSYKPRFASEPPEIPE